MKPEAEFERFYEREAQAVFSAAVLLCRDREQAEDATREAFARALARWNRLGPQPWAAGWVTTTAPVVSLAVSRPIPLARSRHRSAAGRGTSRSSAVTGASGTSGRMRTSRPEPA